MRTSSMSEGVILFVLLARVAFPPTAAQGMRVARDDQRLLHSGVCSWRSRDGVGQLQESSQTLKAGRRRDETHLAPAPAPFALLGYRLATNSSRPQPCSS